MKNRIARACLLSIFSLIYICASAQMLTPSKTNIDFGNVYTNTLDSEIITLKNNYSNPINVLEIHLYDTAFSTPITQFQIAANSSVNITVYFKPTQNVKYKSGLIILSEGIQGNLALNLTGQGKYKDTYYASTENLWEEDLKAALKTLISGHTSLGYNGGRDKMFMEIDNKKVNGQGATQNTLECVYTGREAVGYTDRADAQTNFQFNTEHTFPQSFFNSLEPMKSDLHHLFPTDEVANNRRSNDPFGVVSTATWQEAGSKSNGSVFEPRDEHKGNAARALFYFVTRYQDYSKFVENQEPTLRKWLQQDTVDAAERKRNDDIYKYQKNRNPLIDHPEFAARITSFTTIYVAPDDYSYSLPLNKAAFGKFAIGDSVIFNIPVEATGNKAITAYNLHFASSDYHVRKGQDTILPGESGFISFVYKPVAVFKSHIDTIYYSIQSKSAEDIKLPISIEGSVGLKETVTENAEISLYPNPVSQTLYITMPENASVNGTEIYNMLGEKVLQTQSTATQINTSTLPKGIYIIKIKAGEKVYSRKIIKQ